MWLLQVILRETKDVSVTQKMIQNLCFTYAQFSLLNQLLSQKRQLKVAPFAFTTRLSAVSLSFFLLKKWVFFSFLIPKHCLLKYTRIYVFFACTRSELWHMGSCSQTSDRTPAPCIGSTQSWTTREVPDEIILKSYKFGEHALLLPGNFIPQHLNKNVTVDTLFEGTYKLLASVKH